MEFEIIEQILVEASQQVLDNDRYLLDHDINEPAISHRLAVYLEPRFHNFNVDCEYNGNVDADSGRKYINLLRETAYRLGLADENANNPEIFNQKVVPDIIVHKRGLNGSENNLLIVEVKKSTNQDPGAWDAEKLSRFTSSDHENNFNYQYGAFVRFTVCNQPSFIVHWYQSGQRL